MIMNGSLVEEDKTTVLPIKAALLDVIDGILSSKNLSADEKVIKFL
jgi:hypothetical protein